MKRLILWSSEIIQEAHSFLKKCRCSQKAFWNTFKKCFNRVLKPTKVLFKAYDKALGKFLKTPNQGALRRLRAYSKALNNLIINSIHESSKNLKLNNVERKLIKNFSEATWNFLKTIKNNPIAPKRRSRKSSRKAHEEPNNTCPRRDWDEPERSPRGAQEKAQAKSQKRFQKAPDSYTPNLWPSKKIFLGIFHFCYFFLFPSFFGNGQTSFIITLLMMFIMTTFSLC